MAPSVKLLISVVEQLLFTTSKVIFFAGFFVFVFVFVLFLGGGLFVLFCFVCLSVCLFVCLFVVAFFLS